MSEHHNPRPLSPEELLMLSRFIVDTEAGKVYTQILGREPREVGSRLRCSRDGTGYIYVNLWIRGKAKHIKRANVVWWAATGIWPERLLDHKDRDPHNDAVSNLELSTQRENLNNIGLALPIAHLEKTLEYRPWKVQR